MQNYVVNNENKKEEIKQGYAIKNNNPAPFNVVREQTLISTTKVSEMINGIFKVFSDYRGSKISVIGNDIVVDLYFQYDLRHYQQFKSSLDELTRLGETEKIADLKKNIAKSADSKYLAISMAGDDISFASSDFTSKLDSLNKLNNINKGISNSPINNNGKSKFNLTNVAKEMLEPFLMYQYGNQKTNWSQYISDHVVNGPGFNGSIVECRVTSIDINKLIALIFGEKDNGEILDYKTTVQYNTRTMENYLEITRGNVKTIAKVAEQIGFMNNTVERGYISI